MSEKNLPIKLVLQRTSDTQKNQGGGGIKFFCEVPDYELLSDEDIEALF